MKVGTFVIGKARPTAVALVLIATLGGCEGSDVSPGTDISSGTDTSGPSPVRNGPPPDSPPSPEPYLPSSNGDTGGGIWWGTLKQGGRVVNGAMCLVVEAGELACLLSATADQGQPLHREPIVGAVHGTVRVSNASQASGSGKVYATPGNVLADGSSVVADFTITGGSLTENNSLLELTFTSLGEESTFSGFFDHYYVVIEPAFLWPAHGVYTTFDIYGDPASLSITPDGALFVQSASGCSGNGQMTNTPGHTPNVSAYNAYTVDLMVSDCPGLNGAYEGLATLIDFSWVNGTDNLVIAVFNDTTAIVGEAVK